MSRLLYCVCWCVCWSFVGCLRCCVVPGMCCWLLLVGCCLFLFVVVAEPIVFSCVSCVVCCVAVCCVVGVACCVLVVHCVRVFFLVSVCVVRCV